MMHFAHNWTNPWRRPKALLRLLRSVGRLLPDRPDCYTDFATWEMTRYIRPAIDDVLRWLGEATLGPLERPDSKRVITTLTGAVDACSIGDAVYRDLRRRALRQLAQRRRRAAKAAAQGRPVKPALAARAKAPHAPRAPSRGRTAGPQADRGSAAPASSSTASIAMSRRGGSFDPPEEAGGLTSLKPSLPLSAQAPYAPRALCLLTSPPVQLGKIGEADLCLGKGEVGRADRRGLASGIAMAAAVKPFSLATTQAPLTPRASLLGRTAGPQADRRSAAPASSSAANSAMGRPEAGGPTSLRPSLVARAQAPHAPRAALSLAHRFPPFLRRARPPPATAA